MSWTLPPDIDGFGEFSGEFGDYNLVAQGLRFSFFCENNGDNLVYEHTFVYNYVIINSRRLK